jgi:hypothetical protein
MIFYCFFISVLLVHEMVWYSSCYISIQNQASIDGFQTLEYLYISLYNFVGPVGPCLETLSFLVMLMFKFIARSDSRSSLSKIH